MTEPDEHERVVELLQQARLPAEKVTPDHLEENLRWLVHSARPEMKAPEALRERVQALTAARRARPASLFGGIFTSALPVRPRMLLGIIPLAAACIVLFLLLTSRARAQMLARTLRAMAQVRTAHCIGIHVEYRSRGKSGQPLRVEWWYKAPDWYRKDQEPEGSREEMPSSRLIVKGEQGVATIRSTSAPESTVALDHAALTQHLWPLDFFSRQGFLEHAEADKAARVTIEETTYHETPIQVIQVVANESRTTGRYRNCWVLYVDPATDRILRSVSRLERQTRDGAWHTRTIETLDRFEYDVPVKDSLFERAPSRKPLRSDAS